MDGGSDAHLRTCSYSQRVMESTEYPWAPAIAGTDFHRRPSRQCHLCLDQLWSLEGIGYSAVLILYSPPDKILRICLTMLMSHPRTVFVVIHCALNFLILLTDMVSRHDMYLALLGQKRRSMACKRCLVI